jgi:hypothetical protein
MRGMNRLKEVVECGDEKNPGAKGYLSQDKLRKLGKEYDKKHKKSESTTDRLKRLMKEARGDEGMTVFVYFSYREGEYDETEKTITGIMKGLDGKFSGRGVGTKLADASYDFKTTADAEKAKAVILKKLVGKIDGLKVEIL